MSRFRRYAPLLLVLAIGLLLRVLLWGRIPRTGLISDEGEYLAAATWLAEGRNFSWYTGYLWTRAPVYPLFVAAHLWLFGGRVEAVYLTQTLLSLVNVVLVYALSVGTLERWSVGAKSEGKRIRGQEERISDFRLSSFVFRLFGTTDNGQWAIVPFIAALLMAVYLPFALYPQVLLSETLYLTLLLSGFLALGASLEWRIQNGEFRIWEFASRLFPLALAGVLFGLAALTRSLTLGFIPVVALWLLAQRWTTNDREPRTDERLTTDNGQRTTDSAQQRANNAPTLKRSNAQTLHRLLPAATFVLAAALVVLPWTLYNSARLYGGLVVVDTTGAFNLMLGARTAFDGRRADAPPRNLALTLLGQMDEAQRGNYLATPLDQGGSCLREQGDAALKAALGRTPVVQAQLQRLITAEGVCLIQHKPLAFVQKSAGEFLDFFQINYSGDERFTDGFTLGRLPQWYTLALFLLDDTLYVLVLPLAAIGFALTRRLQIIDCRLQIGPINLQSTICNLQFLILLWFLFNIAVAPVLFAINRFRLPLLPFVFMFAAYALANLRRVNWRWLRTRGGMLAAGVALALFLVAATPYAYFEPRRVGQDSERASYFGRYPSSLVNTGLALARRGQFLQQEQMRLALRTGDAARAQELRPADVGLKRVGKTVAVIDTVLVDALFAQAAGRTEAALALLPPEQIIAGHDVEAAVARGDMLRSLGRDDAANALLTSQFIDDANPVQWAWDWLNPTPTNAINLGGNLDIGYVRGCYLGESIAKFDDANYRWCTDGAQIRFPKAGTGAGQTLVLRADGRGWQGYASAVPPVQIMLGETEAGSFTPSIREPQKFSIALPPTPLGEDVLITLQTATFIPPADDYNKQQGPLAGQVRRLGVRLDWAELR